MSRELENLRQRLAASVATYVNARRPRTDIVKREAARQSLAAVVAFVRAQGWDGLELNLARMAIALADIERGRSVPWLAKEIGNRPPVGVRISRIRGRAAAEMEKLMKPRGTLSRQMAAEHVLRQLPRNGSIFENTAAKWRTVARWRDDIVAEIKRDLPGRKSVERETFEAALARAK